MEETSTHQTITQTDSILDAQKDQTNNNDEHNSMKSDVQNKEPSISNRDESQREKVMVSESLDGILTRVSSTGRVKFHCLDASKHFPFIIFGANSGSIYFYEKDTSKFIALLSPK